jgi:hypothetical protein
MNFGPIMPHDRATVRLFELGAGRAHDWSPLGLLRHHEGGELGGRDEPIPIVGVDGSASPCHQRRSPAPTR